MGNILNRYSYAFTTGTLGSLTGTKTWYNGTSSTFGKICYGIDGQDDLWIDSFGNPYYNNETCEYFTWNGRELTVYDNGHDEYYYYSYNSDGIRTKKVKSVYGEETSTYYIIDGTKILGEICSDGTSMNYFYDENGSPVALSYSGGSMYYYYKNIFGDILGIMDSCGNVVVRYYYDAWGNIISTTGSMASTLGQDNPFRYRGYYYDTETGFYYLNARYYNPELGRFISSDTMLNPNSAIGCNMFAYCGNDPVNHVDPSGEWFLITLLVACVAGGFIAGFVSDEKVNLQQSPTMEERISPSNTDQTTMTEQNSDDKPEELTFTDRLLNGVAGAACGLAVFGGAAILIGTFGSFAVGSAVATIPVVGLTGTQTFTAGIVAYNGVAILVGPLFSSQMEPIG